MRLTRPPTMASLTEVRLFRLIDASDVPVVRPVALVDGYWTADVTDVPAGRWYVRLVGLDTDGAVVTQDLGYTDLPDDPSLVVSAEVVARKAKIPLPLDAEQREIITDAIRDAQSDVVAFLGREITPVQRTETGRWAWNGAEWNLVGLGQEDLIRIVSVTPEIDVVTGLPTDYFTVTYLMGLDGRNDPTLHPIRRYVKLHAMNSPEVTKLWKIATGAKGEIRSVSAEGQSVSWQPATLGGGGEAGSGKPGALPTLGSLDRWRLAGRRVYQGATRSSNWPFTGPRW